MDLGPVPSEFQSPQKVLPHSIEAEKAVLGSVLRNADNISNVENILRPEYFFNASHQKIYKSMNSLSHENETCDYISVAERLRKLGYDDEGVGPAYLVELAETCPATENVEFYADAVKRHYFLRQLIFKCSETVDRAYKAEGDLKEFIDGVEKEFSSITKEQDKNGIIPADQVLMAAIEQIQENISKTDVITGIPTGLTEMDQLTGGMQRSDLVILAARPGMGKTALALNIAAKAAKEGFNAVIFTLEMTKEQLMGRMLSSEARLDSGRLRKGDLDQDELDRMMVSARVMKGLEYKLGVDETPGITLLELRSRCRNYKKQHGLDLVIIDYLQLMGSTTRSDNREREVSEISKGLKELAKELNVPVIALAQLNRGPDARPDKRPKISDLRESGSMEQDADMIMFVYRDEYYNKDSEAAGQAEVIVAKNRHGETATIHLAFAGNFVKFDNLAQDLGGNPPS